MKITQESYDKAYKPFDIVSNKNGDIGFITEVSCNDCQESFEDQISYSISWLINRNIKSSWYEHDELSIHGNLFIKIAESSINPMGTNRHHVQKLFNAKWGSHRIEAVDVVYTGHNDEAGNAK